MARVRRLEQGCGSAGLGRPSPAHRSVLCAFQMVFCFVFFFHRREIMEMAT